MFAGGGARGAYQVRVLRGLLDFGLLRGDSGVLRAFAIPAKNLYTANGVFFVDARSDVPLWQRGRFSVERTRIRVERTPDGVECDPRLLSVGGDRGAPLRRRLDPREPFR